MTSSPHEPEPHGGPGPYGPPPGRQGGYGPQSDHGQQGGPAPGDHDQGAFGQQDFAAGQGSFDQQQAGQFGQTTGYGQTPGFSAERPRRRTGLIIVAVVAVVVLVGGGVGSYFLFFNSPKGSDKGATGGQTAQQAASGFATTYTALARGMSTDDLTKTKSYLCAQDQTAVQAIYNQQRSAGGADKGFSMQVSAVTTNGDKGTFQINLVDNGASHLHSGNLIRQNNRWIVCNTVSSAG